MSFEQDEQSRAAWELVLDQRVAVARCEAAGTQDVLSYGIELGRRSNLLLAAGVEGATKAGATLAHKHAPYVVDRPELRCDDPHKTSVLIAASHEQWLMRHDLHTAVQVIERLSMNRVDALRKELLDEGRIIATRRGNVTLYVGLPRG